MAVAPLDVAGALLLGRRAVACRDWSWTDDGCLPCVADGPSDDPRYRAGTSLIVWLDRVPCVPDFRDPRAVGWLRALTRKAHAPHVLVEVRGIDGSYAFGYLLASGNVQSIGASGPDDAHALVAALERAP